MASISYSTHPSSNKLPQKIWLGAGESTAAYYYFIPKYYVTSLSSVSVPHHFSGGASEATRYRWNNKAEWGGSNVYLGDNRNTQLKNNFVATRQVLCARVVIINNGTSGSNYTIKAPTITINGTLGTLSQVSIGDSVTAADMQNLKTWLDGYCSGINIGNSIVLTVPTVGTSITAANWANFIQKANAIPTVSGLISPTQYNKIYASDYNAVVTALTG